MENELAVAVVCVTVCAFALLSNVDGRSMRAESKAVHTVRTNFFRKNDDQRQHDVSFRSAFRVGRGCFEALVAFIESKWSTYYKGNPNSTGGNRKFFSNGKGSPCSLLPRILRESKRRVLNVWCKQVYRLSGFNSNHTYFVL
ncbi:hypothetical protein PF001_g30201 [Phytophthora fragariae]|uniref:RxLR effector protein n=1 Tax=Phytophthora fragariae TaxID=53985 RepID=A0A6A4B0R5_9STRA|nr:hypothetical protein PF001_g30201 [Phytophthora fragariae]